MLKKIQIYILPVISLIVIISFFIATQPSPTGMAVVNIKPEERVITAKVTLQLSKNELIPEDSIVIVILDNQQAHIPIKQFIELSNQPYNYTQGTLDIANYQGYGYIGDYTYSIDLSNFNLDTKVFTGKHTFTTKIIYKEKILYEKQNPFTIENA